MSPRRGVTCGGADVGQQVLDGLVPAGDLDRRHAHREARTCRVAALVDEPIERGDRARDHAQSQRRVVDAEHHVRLACMMHHTTTHLYTHTFTAVKFKRILGGSIYKNILLFITSLSF